MSTEQEKDQKRLEELTDKKDVEYYTQSVNAWYNTSLEHDKSLLALSAGGVGLLITLLTAIGVSSAEGLVLNICAILCFVTSLIAVLRVFKLNRSYIEAILSGTAAKRDPILGRLDQVAIFAFGLGAIFTAIIGISAAFQSYSNKEKVMANDEVKKTGTSTLRESFNGAKNIQPADLGKKSFDGAVALQPKPVTSTTTSGTNTPAPASGTMPPAPTTTQKQGNDNK